jgi:hypothetical protein
MHNAGADKAAREVKAGGMKQNLKRGSNLLVLMLD